MNRIIKICFISMAAFGCVPSEDAVPPEAAYLDALSLRDVEPDCEDVFVDPNGTLVPNEGVRRCMDYYLSATGEVSALRIRLAFRYGMFRRLPWSAYREAVALFDQYVQFRTEGRSVKGAPEDPESWIAMIRAVRSSLFAPEWNEALFGADDAAQDAFRTLESGGRATVDPVTQSRLQRSQEVLRVHQKVEEMRAEGKTEAEIYAYRAEIFGDAAAARLADLDRTRADLEARYQTYREARAGQDLSEAEVENLMKDHFTEIEQRRIRAWDRMHYDI